MMTQGKPMPRIERVTVLPGRSLRLYWRDGEVAEVSLSGWIATGGDAFAPLNDAALFATAAVADYGLAVHWCGDEDLAIDSYHLALIAEQQQPLLPEDIARWQERMGLSNQEAADLFGIAVSTWHTYKSGSKVPVAVQIGVRAVERDKLLFEAYYRPRRTGRPPKLDIAGKR